MKCYLSKIYAAFILIMGVASTPSLAQGPPNGRQGPPPIPNEVQIEKMVSDLSSELSLSKEQQARVQGLYIEHFNELKELRKNDEEQRAGQRKKMEALRGDFEKEVQADFSKEQRELYVAFQEKRGERRKEKGRPSR